MIWTDKVIYRCVQATAYSPEEYAQAWKKYEGTDDGESGEVGTEEWPEFKKPQAQMMLIMQGRRLHSKESTIYVLLLLAILAHILQ